MAVRKQLEVEQEDLKRKKAEREERRLRRQMELADAQHGGLPPPPADLPPPVKTRGRQMSNVI